VVTRHFSPPTIAEFVDRARDLVAHHRAMVGTASKPVELTGDFALPLTTSVIAEFVGVPADLRDGLLDAVGLPLVDQQARLCDLSGRLLNAPHGQLQRDLVDAVATGALSHDEAVGLLGLILFAGHETTTGLIANAAVTLAGRTDLHRRLRSDPKLISAFVDEVLRVDSPVQHIGRYATQDFEFGNSSIHSGELIALLPGAANRDTAVFADADQVDLARTGTSTNLAFGWGRHYCLGAPLARLEAELAVHALVETFEAIAVLEPLTYRAPANIRCPTRLLIAPAN
jgi:cytochrome P450